MQGKGEQESNCAQATGEKSGGQCHIGTEQSGLEGNHPLCGLLQEVNIWKESTVSTADFCSLSMTAQLQYVIDNS